MGLDTTHNCWHGSYSSFNSFRRELCCQIGINLYDLIGYGGNKMHEENIQHDIMPLINHSDCDGILTVEESKKVLKGLYIISSNLDEKKLDNPSYFKSKLYQFIGGLELAIDLNEPVEFQ